MASITNYATLTQAIADWTHRADLTAGATPFSDYFIQSAIERIQNDIPDLNFGNYVQPMEAAYGPVDLQGGITPVPSDWLGAKVLTVADGQADAFPLIMKATSWLYDAYPLRQPAGLPAYISRDVMAPCSFTGSISIGNTLDGEVTIDSGITLDASAEALTVTAIASGILQPGMVLAGVGLPTGVTTALIIIGQVSGVPGGIGLYAVANVTVAAASQSMTGGGDIFVYGPFPDASYTVSGTYYQDIPELNSSATTNWLVTKYPNLLLAGCMVEAAGFLTNDAMIQRWEAKYQSRLKAMMDADKAERWAASTLQVEVG